ncbi:MAG: hypothetical protein IPH44_15140 [Myxococcales bacterium]|jgi:hypothetical protein|nr:hypothetical protein [Myxococcales bacterium]MBK7193263.1 hypothetical protein [Myxococcales bacterium]MBK9034130.1 hypothetical protein [Myxococcales bacterium]MBP6842327.1 hypothetical protein [Kofleriaceae bacterium]
MARARRTQFATPLVMVVASACGSSKAPDPKPEPQPTDTRPRWTLTRQGDRCTALQQRDCPPGASCNPPPPFAIACADLPEGATRIVELKPGRCVVDGGNRLVTCPVELPPPPPPPSTVDAGVAAAASDASAAVAVAQVRWQVQRSPKGCAAFEDVCSQANFPPGQPVPPCNPPAPIKIECPPDDVVAIREVSPGRCMTQVKDDCPPDVKCNPPPPEDIACPKR